MGSEGKLAEHVVVAGRFRLNRLLGKGGMGSVWHATDIRLETPCAIKFIEGDLSTLPDMVKRFQREAKAAAELRSPHVVQVFDHDIWEGIPFIAMELLEGEDLRKRLDRVRRLSRQETIDILSQVARALSRAHAIGIVHRDLKPENIYLTHDLDREIVKILDFGIAKRTAGPNVESNTKSGALLGTPYYMSPEQAQGLKEVDARSDLWSLAVIAFECMTGRVPFESEAFGDLLLKIMVQPLPVPSAVAPVPKRFDAWWAKAASRDPNARFQNVAEFIRTLAEALGVSVPSAATSSALRETEADLAFEPTSPPEEAPPKARQVQTNAAVSRTFSDAPKKNESSNLPLIVSVVGGALIAAGAFVFYPSSSAKKEQASPTSALAPLPVATSAGLPAAPSSAPAAKEAPRPIEPQPVASAPAPPPAASASAKAPAGDIKPQTGSAPKPASPARKPSSSTASPAAETSGLGF